MFQDISKMLSRAPCRKSRDYIFLIELMAGGKRESVNTAEITVRRILD